MKIKAVLFDLDGTLLPMDQDEFINRYMKLLAARLAPRGYDPKVLIDAIWKGTAAMIKNDGTRMNEAVFWDTFSGICGKSARADLPHFDEFYRTDFNKVQSVCHPNPMAAAIVSKLKRAGIRTVLATNPVFPAIATENRMRWAGLETTDFDLYTTYENIGYCKPNPAYFLTLAGQLELQPEECLMVGNDVDDDMVAAKLGMHVFLLTDYLINKKNADIDAYPHGDFDALSAFIDGVIDA